ncbi:hypothetical protein HDV01_006501 [Terramyces sp. JEL0728]|nr:hypothetical protein HDV01_006501 [Terramyces sp. JEL0728]
MEDKLLLEQEKLISPSVLKHSNYDCSSFGEKQIAFAKTCCAIRTIIKHKLYRVQSTNLEQYFLKRFNVSRAQVYRLMDCAAVLDCLEGISPTPHKYRICKELKKKASLGPEIRTCWENVLAHGTSEEQLDTFDFELIQKLSVKRKRKDELRESPILAASGSFPQSPPSSDTDVAGNSDSTYSPKSRNSPMLNDRRPDWKSNAESLNKPIDTKTVKLPGISSFSSTINDFEFSKSYQLNSSESVPFLNTPTASSCTCIHKGNEPRLPYSKYLTISSPPACTLCSKIPDPNPNSYEYIKSEFDKCQRALSTLAELGYQLTPFLNGRWEKAPISEWRIVPTSQLADEPELYLPGKRFKNTSLSSTNSFDSLILAAGIV